MASDSWSYILRRSIFSCLTSDIRLDTIINVHPTCSCSKTKWLSLYFAPASEICSAVLSLGVRSDSMFSGLWCVCMIALMRERSNGSNNPSLILDAMPLSIAEPILSAIIPASKLSSKDSEWSWLASSSLSSISFSKSSCDYSSACVLASSELSDPFFSIRASSNASRFLNSL